jgi:hypothetical protein
MKWKHAIAGTLSLLLLGVTSLASACELSCSLSPSHPVSTPLSAAPADSMAPATQVNKVVDSATMSHSHCGHAGMGRRSSAATHHFEDTSSCRSAPCAQAQVLSSPISDKYSAQIESRHLAVIIATVSAVEDASSPSEAMQFEHAPPRLVLVDPLSVALRI